MLIEYDFFQNAILGSLGAAVLCAIIGSYIVTRRLVIVGGGISHAALGGVGLGAFLGIPPLLGATVFSLLSAYGIKLFSTQKERKDSAIAILWTFGMAIGLLFAYLTPHFTHALSSYLFGNILLIDTTLLFFIASLTIITLSFYLIFRSAIITIAYDKDFARTQGLPVAFIEWTLLTLTSLTIVCCLRLAGILLVVAMLSIPQQTASLLTKKYKNMVRISAVIAFVGTLIGLYLSYIVNAPSGPLIILSYISIYVSCRIVLWIRKNINRLHTTKLMFVLLTIFSLSACSTKKNTPQSRFWQAFTTRYNTLFNAQQAFDEGVEEQYKQGEEHFTQLLPYSIVENEPTTKIGGGHFSRAIKKSQKAIDLHSITVRPKRKNSERLSIKEKEFMNRKEYNAALSKAWLLMGKAQYHKGDFSAAIATFSYVCRLYETQPKIAHEASIYLSRAYTAMGWIYDARQALEPLRLDTTPRHLVTAHHAAKADLLLQAGLYAEALPHLLYTAPRAHPRIQKARLYFLTAQIYKKLNNRKEATRMLKKCLRQSPPYKMALSARLLQTQVLPLNTDPKSITRKLKRMSRSEKNKDHLEKIFFALGNVYLHQRDTLQATIAYETGRRKATHEGTDKATLLLQLAGLYWDMQKYDKAQSAYNDALSLITRHTPNYDLITKRSEILDALVPYTNVIQREDSLQHLALLPEMERLKIIDDAIDRYKAEEKRLAQLKADSMRKTQGGNDVNPRASVNSNSKVGQDRNTAWYFYNPSRVRKGIQDFIRLWGKRENADDWRRSNKTILAQHTTEGIDYDKMDSIKARQDSIVAEEEEKGDSEIAPEEDPHKRAFYLKDIPLTEQQRALSDSMIAEALYHAAIIEKDELEDFTLAEKSLYRLVTQYPSFPLLADAYTHLFLLQLRQQHEEKAEKTKAYLSTHYPNLPFTRRINEPDFLYLAKNEKRIEDSLYRETYRAYLNNDTTAVREAYQQSTQHFATAPNRAKFKLVYALSAIPNLSTDSIYKMFNEIVSEYPKSEEARLSAYIVKGLKAGRVLHADNASAFTGLWNKRLNEAEKEAAVADSVKLTDSIQTPFAFVILFPQDSISAADVLYSIAHFNFSGFHLRSFDIEQLTTRIENPLPNTPAAYVSFRIHGFNSLYEARKYANEAMADSILANKLRETKLYLISEENLKLIPEIFSYAEYERFYMKHFAPITTKKVYLDRRDRKAVKTSFDDSTPTIIYPRDKKNPLVPNGKKKKIEKKKQENELNNNTIDSDEEDLYPL